MLILGLSAFYHDSAAALIRGEEILAAAQEERFTRKKHDSRFPVNAIQWCLDEHNLSLGDIDYIAFYDKPFLKFERLLETYLTFAPKGFSSFRKAIPVWIKDKLFQRKQLIELFERHFDGIGVKEKLLFSEHHFSHAASAFYPSPFEKSVVLTMDGVGEWATTSVAIGDGHSLDIVKEINFPHSLGLLYSAFTYFTGFKVNSGEYKVMGLAPYGSPKYKSLILEHLIHVKEDGSYRLNMDYFNYCTGLTMTNERFANLFGQKVRKPEDPLTQFHMDMAASVQAVTEEVVLKMTRSLAKETGIPNLCLAGGVALNCVANGKVLRDKSFEQIWVQPAAGDAGGALGAALAAYHKHKGMPRRVWQGNSTLDNMQGAYLGPSFDSEDVCARLTSCGAKFDVMDSSTMYEELATLLAEGKVMGWFQGKMEFGPRALGGRSIIGDPRSAQMQKIMNLKIKYRESFRPFAPSVLAEDVGDWFEMETKSPYMLMVADVVESRRKKMSAEDEELFGIDKLNVVKSEIPAVTHVDYSARIQTVHKETNPKYHKLIETFKSVTGCSLLVNTSFNVRGEPIVCTPEDAFRCFMGTDMDVLVVENVVLYKEKQEKALALDYKSAFELD